MTARSIVDPSPPWTSLLPPARSRSRSRSSSQTSKPKPTGKRPKNGSQLQIQTSSRANPQSTTSLSSNGSRITTTTATYSGGTTLRRYTTLPPQQSDSSPPLLALSLPSSTPPSIPIDTCTHPPALDHHPCPHGCDRSGTPITSISFSVTDPLTDPVTEPIFPSDPLDIFPTNTTPTGSGSGAGSGSGSRRSSTLSKEWRHDPKRNKKAQEAASRIIEGCDSRKKRGRRWRMRDRVRKWGRELKSLRGPRDGGGRVRKGYDGDAGVGGAGQRGEGGGKGEARWSWRRGWKGVRDADNELWGFEGHVRTHEPAHAVESEETRWQPALGDIIPAPPPIPKPPRNSVVMERLAEVLGASSTETSFGFKRRDYLRQAEEKDTKNRIYADYADRGEVHEHEKMQSKSKNRTSGLWKRGLEKVKKLLVLSESRKARSASRTATGPYIASRAKIVDTSLLHPHWRGRQLGEVKGIKDSQTLSESPAGTLLPPLHRRSKNHPSQPAAMEVPETTTTMDRNNKADESDEESMVAPPTYWYVDENEESHFGERKLPRSAKEKGKGIDYSQYHEDSVFKIHRPGFPPPRPGPKERCECRNCTTALDLVAMTSAGNPGSGPFLQTYQGHRLVPSYRTADFTRSSRSISSSQTPPAGQFQPLPSLPLFPSTLESLVPSNMGTWLPTIRPSMDFSQAPEFSAFTLHPTVLPGTFQESAVRWSLTPSVHSSSTSSARSSLTPCYGEDEDNNFWLVTHSENKHHDDLVEEDEYDAIEGEEAYHSEGKVYTKSLKTTTSEQIPTRTWSKTWTKTWTKTPTKIQTKIQMKTPPKPTGQQRTTRPQRLLKNQFHPSHNRRILESEEDRLQSSPAKHVSTDINSDGLDSDQDQGHEQYDETHHPRDRAPSYVGTGQRPPSRLFFTRPRPRALAALASSSSSSSSSATTHASSSASVFASVSAALPSPVPEEGSSNIADTEEHDSQVHDNLGHQSNDKHRHSHHSHHNHYSKSSSNSKSNSNGNHRSFRSSWSLSISIISTRASSPHSFRNSKRESKRESKSNRNSSNNKTSSKNKDSTGSNPHAGSSSWYKTKTTSTNRKRSSTTSTTGSSRVSSLDKVTSNDSSSRASHSHSHSRSHSNQTTGTIDSGSGNESTLEGTGESGNGLRHTRTASVQVESDLLIIPLEEVEDYVIPPSDSFGDLPDDELDGEPEGDFEGEHDAEDDNEDVDGGHAETKRARERDRDGQRDEGGDNRQGQWEWERERTAYVRGDGGGGGWRIVNGADGNNVRVRVKEVGVGGEGTGTVSGSLVTNSTGTSGTGLWMKDSRGTLGTVRTERSLGSVD